MPDASKNTLYYGDNLMVLPKYVQPESVDLIYLDPPFNSEQDYNVFLKEKGGAPSAAQIKAFEDTWEWSLEAEAAYLDVVQGGGPPSAMLAGFLKFLGKSDLMAYLAMMAPRLKELHRVLKPTGSLYLHCDPAASHYLKLLLDSIFGTASYRTEIVWKRSSAHNDAKQGRKIHGHIHDVVFFYTKSDSWTWNPQYTPYTKEYLESEYKHKDAAGRWYKETDLTAAKPGGDTEYDWHVKRKAARPEGKQKPKPERWIPDLDDEYKNPKPGMEYKAVPPYGGRFWAYSKGNLVQFWKDGKLIHRSTGMPRLMQYADEMPGVVLQDLWTDIPPELTENDMGYPTQKPEPLLERIIKASTNDGDVVLDPFCGCGTAVSVAQRLRRRWLGIDITHLAVALIRKRLLDAFGKRVEKGYEVVGEPTVLSAAETLAAQDHFQFQCWCVGKLGGSPLTIRRGADRGIDGRRSFIDDTQSMEQKDVIFSVKGGDTKPADVRDLRGVIEREDAAIGVFVCLGKPTKEMEKEAASAGFYQSPFGGNKYPRIQIFTAQDIIDGKDVAMPPNLKETTFRTAPKAKPTGPVQKSFLPDEA